MLGETFSYYDGASSSGQDELSRRKDTVRQVVEYFDDKQLLFSPSPIPARDIFVERLENLADGNSVDVICFNCIDFTYKANGGNYPQASALDDTDSALVECYREEMTDAVTQLRRLGDPKVTIIVPDSELTDGNVFNFSQKEKERQQIGQRIRQQLSERFVTEGVSVMLWSDFLESRGLPPAQDYTQRNLPLVMGKYRRNVKDMVADSQAYFIGKGIGVNDIAKVAPAEIAIRSAWYLSMYAGEGNAMTDLGNVVMLNFENDGKVLAWSQRGAQGFNIQQEVLPIITPADTRRFKAWKDGLKIKRRSGV